MKRFRALAWTLAILSCLAALVGWMTRKDERVAVQSVGEPLGFFDPLAEAVASKGLINNYEATVPAQCYTKTAGVANPCWTCHVRPFQPNELEDWDLQEEYAFSDVALSNHWGNLFRDVSDFIDSVSDEEILAYIREDNYTPLRAALADRADYPGFKPDLDFRQGFDQEGFALDGSGWRAIRYKPFLGPFWPTNGNSDDVLIRLPASFQTVDGLASREIYKINLAILEAVIAGGPNAGKGADFRFVVEPIDETVAGFDLNGDETVGGMIDEIRGFPKHFAGDARDVTTRRYVYPEGVEFLHSVRYVDPDAPSMIAERMKELRYSKKVDYLDAWAISYRYEREYNEKEEGELPIFAGSPLVGLRNGFGWQLQGFIEDEQGRLRLQTHEEHQFCMGCHSAIGVTVDHTFTLARKVPGAAGWRYQDLAGIPDAPQQGHDTPEIALYFERVTGGDEFRANDEIIARFFQNGRVIEEETARAAPGGDQDIRYLLEPSRGRALALNKAYLAIVREQSYTSGRDTVIGPVDNVHAFIENGETDLAGAGKVFKDGRLWLDWPQ